MRICLVLEASGGGAGRHVLDLSRGLIARGHDVHLVYSPVRAEPIFLDALREAKVSLSELEMNRGIGPGDFKSALRLGRLLKRIGPFDIVHAHSSKAGAILRLVPSLQGKIVYTPHAFRSLDPTTSFLARMFFDVAESLLALRTDAIVLVSRDELDHARRLGIAGRKLHVVRNSIPPLALRDRAAVREELSVAGSALAVGFIGRFSHQKAPETFVAAMERVMAAHPDVVAVMIGDGDLRDSVAGCVARSAYADRFRLLGARRSADYLAGFDVLLMTSRYEAMSYVMLEALAAGLPLVTTPVAGASEIIVQDGNGVIVGSHEAAPVAEAVGRIVGDRALLSGMSDMAVQQDKSINGDHMVIETEQLYRQLLGRA
ncbi:glycosyltransferase [Sphingomonas sp. AP4-R1]|uniref:glycosyltransferase n=1 Tax=Sphingomonas sp. AP4-R1 TaxID=2735134 RepID=UPI00149336A2|nr:glycosyltransferase [Sphingomonas sp. AP4-R1]QJU57262.1 glycosyltransferase [Sphingomonas sp. AP4-R1]